MNLNGWVDEWVRTKRLGGAVSAVWLFCLMVSPPGYAGDAHHYFIQGLATGVLVSIATDRVASDPFEGRHRLKHRHDRHRHCVHAQCKDKYKKHKHCHHRHPQHKDCFRKHRHVIGAHHGVEFSHREREQHRYKRLKRRHHHAHSHNRVMYHHSRWPMRCY